MSRKFENINLEVFYTNSVNLQSPAIRGGKNIRFYKNEIVAGTQTSFSNNFGGKLSFILSILVVTELHPVNFGGKLSFILSILVVN